MAMNKYGVSWKSSKEEETMMKTWINQAGCYMLIVSHIVVFELAAQFIN